MHKGDAQLSNNAPLASAVNLPMVIPSTDNVLAEHSVKNLTEAFNLSAAGKGHQDYDGPLIVHLEDSSHFFLNRNQSLHGFAASKILSDRTNARREKPVPVYHLDINPLINTVATREAFSRASVITVSTALFDPPDVPKDFAKRSDPKNIDRQDVLEKRAPYLKPANYSPSFWTKTNSVIVAAVGNYAASGWDKCIGFTSIYESDSLILVGSILPENNDKGTCKVAGYSSKTPDLVAFEAFDQGFSHPKAASELELRSFYNKMMAGGPPESLVQQVASRSPELTNNGTSFAAPDVGGYIARGRIDYPELEAREIATAAYLATTIYTDGSRVHPDYFWNAAGLPFDPGQAGHGAFLPEMFSDFLAAYSEHKEETGKEPKFQRVTVPVSPADKNIFSCRFMEKNGDLTVIRTVGELSFFSTVAEPIDNFPDNVKVESPAGTIYEVPLKKRCTSMREVFTAFSVTAFLGEKAEGEWKIHIPEGYMPLNALMTQTGVKDHGNNTINWLIDHSRDYKRKQPQPILPKMDNSPWTERKQNSASVLRFPAP